MKKNQIFWCLIGIIFLATFFRLWKINSVPTGLFYDEAINGLDAIESMKIQNFKFFYTANTGREGLFINLASLNFKIFGVHIWSLRMVSAIFGILTVFGLYLLTKELFDEQTGLIASFLLAISFWHINFSRIAFRGILMPFCLVFGFYFLIKALRQNYNLRYLLWSGLFFGIGFHTYFAFRIVPLIILIPIIFQYFYNPPSKKERRNLLIFFLLVLLIAVPFCIYTSGELSRISSLSIFQSGENLFSIFIQIIKNFFLTLLMFNYRGDPIFRHNFLGKPMLSFFVGIFFWVGILKTIFKENAFKKTFLFSWLFILILPSILTNEIIPHALRTIGIIPVVYIFASLGFIWIIRKIKNFNIEIFFIKKIYLPIEIIFILSSLLILIPFSYHKYFNQFANHQNTYLGFESNITNIGKHLGEISPQIHKIVIDTGNHPDSIRFLTYNDKNVYFFSKDELEKIFDKINALKKEDFNQRILIIPTTLSSYKTIIPVLQDKYPYTTLNIFIDKRFPQIPNNIKSFWKLEI